MVAVFFALLVKDKKDWSEQIFSHKSSYTQCVCTLLLLYAVFVAALEQKSDKWTLLNVAFIHPHQRPRAHPTEMELHWFLWRLKSCQCIFGIFAAYESIQQLFDGDFDLFHLRACNFVLGKLIEYRSIFAPCYMFSPKRELKRLRCNYFYH